MTLALFDPAVVELGAEADRDTWTSPAEIVGALLRFTGGEPVDLDPCSNERSIVPARVRWTRADATTADPIRVWVGTVYVNWPFSTPEPWARACAEEAARCRWIVGCGICDPSVGWWRHVWRAAAICFPDHRVQFGCPPGARESSNSHPIALPLWLPPARDWHHNGRERAADLDAFEAAFSPLGKVVRLCA